MKTRFFKIIGVLLLVIVLELVLMSIWHISVKSKSQDKHETKMDIVKANQEQEKNKLRDNFDERKYLASGRNVYERIYNRPNQSIIDLITNIAAEALPKDWRSSVKVEEFTNFMLNIQVKNYNDKPSIETIAKYLIPIVKHTSPDLKNIAVFDKHHCCYLFFDEEILDKLKINGSISPKDFIAIQEQGEDFKKFNSLRIAFQRIEGHIFLPAIIEGAYECLMLLDTGASVTVISRELAAKTAFEKEDLNKAETKSFSTAKGYMTCPIVTRSVSLSGVEKKLSVAVNVNDNSNLLGVDFFKGYDYTIDSQDNCIYIWSR